MNVNLLRFATDDDGMILEELERILERTKKVKIIYVIPEFQNPTGKTWSFERRKLLVNIAMKHKVNDY